MEKVLITGVSGFVGSWLAEEKSNMNEGKIHKSKGKTYEQIYGKQIAQKLKRLQAEQMARNRTNGVVVTWNKGGKGLQVGWCKGLTAKTDDKVRKISEKLKGQDFSKERKANISKALKGKKRSEESRRKQSNTCKELWKTTTYREKMLKVRGTEEVKQKIRNARLKQVIPQKDTSIEVKLQKELLNTGISFVTHHAIIGQPDIFIEPNICIFVDGNYWHSLPEVRDRDKKVIKTLEQEGYSVLRFSESEINKDIHNCANKIWEVAT